MHTNINTGIALRGGIAITGRINAIFMIIRMHMSSAI